MSEELKGRELGWDDEIEKGADYVLLQKVNMISRSRVLNVDVLKEAIKFRRVQGQN